MEHKESLPTFCTIRAGRFREVNVSKYSNLNKVDKVKATVLFAKLSTGEILQYHYAADDPGVYEERYPELAKTLEYLGEGSFYSVDGKVSEHVRTKTQYFWRKKVDVLE